MSSVLVAGPESIGELLCDIAAAVRRDGHSVAITHNPILTEPAELLGEMKVLICAATPFGKAELAASPNIRAVISPIIGYDWIDVGAATAGNVLVVNGETSENFESMAEATIMLMLTSLYDLKAGETQLREMRPRPKGPMPARMVSGKAVGIIGYGNISRAIIRRLAGWDVSIVVSTKTPDPNTTEVTFVSLDELIERSDVVIVMTNLSPENNNLINADRLKRLKPGCVFINTARGGLVDEAELCQQIRGGRIAKAALDVFAEEPLGPDNPLRSLPNTILTDHIVGHTREMYDAIPRVAALNASEVMSGKVPTRTRNLDAVAGWQSKWNR